MFDTAEGALAILDASSADRTAAVSDNLGRVHVYSLETGRRSGRVFGHRPNLSPLGDRLCVEIRPGRLVLYETHDMQKTHSFDFLHPVATLRFSTDGNELLVVTSDQTVYVIALRSAA